MSDGDNEIEAIANRQLQEKSVRLRRTLDEALVEFSQPLQLPAGSGASSNAAALGRLRDALRSISTATVQKDVLESLLDAASGYYARCALFVMKRDRLWGWAGRGFTQEHADGDRRIPGIVLPVDEDHLLARAARSRVLMTAGSEGPGKTLTAALGGARPPDASAVPILLRDRPVAILYCDGASSRDSSEALWLEIIAGIGGLALAHLAGEPAGRAHREIAGPAPELSSTRSTPPADPVTPSPPAADPELQPLLADLQGSARRETGEGEQPLSDEVRRFYDDARRFASLLVSELLLYNEEAVIQGRRNRDLRRRLSTEIERSRQAYASRVSPEVAGSTSFFDDELVRVLAEGDASLLSS